MSKSWADVLAQARSDAPDGSVWRVTCEGCAYDLAVGQHGGLALRLAAKHAEATAHLPIVGYGPLPEKLSYSAVTLPFDV